LGERNLTQKGGAHPEGVRKKKERKIGIAHNRMVEKQFSLGCYISAPGLRKEGMREEKNRGVICSSRKTKALGGAAGE